MAQLKGTDFFDLSGLLSDDEVQIQNMAYDFVADEVLPVITKHYREGTFPTELVPKMGHLGFYGANLPEKYGCAGLNNVAYGLLMQELERGDSGVRSFASELGVKY